MNNEEEKAIYISATADPITVILGALAAISLIAANVFIFTMPLDEGSGWVKPTIGILFNFLWISNFYQWIIKPLKDE
jgi:hypothetical protein